MTTLAWFALAAGCGGDGELPTCASLGVDVCLCRGSLGRLLEDCPENPNGNLSFTTTCTMGTVRHVFEDGIERDACEVRFVSSDTSVLDVRVASDTNGSAIGWIPEGVEDFTIFLDTIANVEGAATLSVFDNPSGVKIDEYDVDVRERCGCVQ